jgi:hypothetical protein
VKRYHRAPRLGTRVTFKPETLFDISYYRGKRLQPGTCGKVSQIAGPKGKDVYCDPMNRLVAVRWDNGKMLCVPPKTLVQGCEGSLGCCGLGERLASRGARRDARTRVMQKRVAEAASRTKRGHHRGGKLRDLKRSEGYWANGVPMSRHPAQPPTAYVPRAQKLTKQMRRKVDLD